jgi:L-aspartate oxidase
MDGSLFGAKMNPGNGLGRQPVRLSSADVIVIGSGMAGLVAALRLTPRRVTLLTKTADLPGGSSHWAQGGIAAALGDGDSPDDHAADTVTAGAGLTDPAMAGLLARDGAAALSRWIDSGLPADRDGGGRLLLGREAAHGAARVVHAGGDATGRTMMAELSARVRQARHITVSTECFAWDLVVVRGRCVGVLAHDPQGWVFHRAPSVILATGGSGQLYRHTTNPAEATGDGLALAARAGLALRDLEFVQFHPTALAGDAPGRTPLLTEALRGAGAFLLDQSGQRFMPAEHPLAELAPRDIVARAIGSRVARGERVYLDLRQLWSETGFDDGHGGGAVRFPTVAAICVDAGLDPAVSPIPIAPAAHYQMGGVPTDRDGRTALPGLWAIGETASTGVHGANRLASNSLLEAMVFAERAAAAILAAPIGDLPPVPLPRAPVVTADPVEAAALLSQARSTLSRHVGLVRDEAGLLAALAELSGLQRRADRLPLATAAPAATVRLAGELRGTLLTAGLVTLAALNRTESRGAHCRSDWPQPSAGWRRSQDISLADLTDLHQPALALALPVG